MKRQAGQGQVEYLLILLLVAIIVILILLVFGDQLRNLYSDLLNELRLP